MAEVETLGVIAALDDAEDLELTVDTLVFYSNLPGAKVEVQTVTSGTGDTVVAAIDGTDKNVVNITTLAADTDTLTVVVKVTHDDFADQTVTFNYTFAA